MATFADARMHDEFDGHFQQAWAIYEESFPVDERRPLPLHLETQKDPRYTFSPLLDDDAIIVGALGLWQFEAFTFLEHIAISSACRGRGLGTAIVAELRDSAQVPLILEAEAPEMNGQAPKRIRWYESLGFHCCQQHYVQPAYALDQNPVPSRIMSYPHRLSSDDFELIRDTLYSQVYRFVPAS